MIDGINQLPAQFPIFTKRTLLAAMAYLPFIVDLPVKNAGSFQFVMGQWFVQTAVPGVKPAVQTGFVVGFKGSKIFCLSLGKKSLVQWLGGSEWELWVLKHPKNIPYSIYSMGSQGAT